MKRIFSAALCAIALFASCDPNKGGTTVNVTIEVDETKLGDIKPESYEVILTNTASATPTTVQTENGIATAKVVPGIYNILAKASIAENGTMYDITGSKTEVSILADGETHKIAVDMVKASQLIFKEIYYQGCRFETGGMMEDGVTPETSNYFRDQYYEIYNNSDEVAYADGLCIAETTFADWKGNRYQFFDVEGNEVSQEEYVFCQNIWQIPGDGTKYPVQPGESFIIAQWAKNHKLEELTKGASPVDLSGAEFEAFVEEKQMGGIVLTDNPADNLNIVTNPSGYLAPQWLTSVSGTRMIIFRPSTPLRQENWLVNNDPDWVQNYVEVKISDILDGVQMIDGEASVQNLGMPAIVDAGYIWCEGTYNGQSVSRIKDGTLANGSPKYKDTNNTVDDFEVNTTPVIRRDNVAAPNWN